MWVDNLYKFFYVDLHYDKAFPSKLGVPVYCFLKLHLICLQLIKNSKLLIIIINLQFSFLALKHNTCTWYSLLVHIFHTYSKEKVKGNMKVSKTCPFVGLYNNKTNIISSLQNIIFKKSSSYKIM